MCLYSDFWILWEKKHLAPYAVHSDHPWYTRRDHVPQPSGVIDSCGTRSRYRTPFEIDKDRITNSQAFRRLEYKTQVFVTHEGDNYRTRLTHSLEVAEIARHIARALRLNEHLVEAIALGHDLGHAPYGHVAETAINNWLRALRHPYDRYFYFCHNRNSLEVVEHLEPGYDWDARRSDQGFGQGLDLTLGVREGILVHNTMGYRGAAHLQANFGDKHEEAIRRLSKATRLKGLHFPGSLEAQVVRAADDLAQRVHDLEDGFRSGLIKKTEVCERIRDYYDSLLRELKPTFSAQEGLVRLSEQTCDSKVSALFIDHVVSMLDDPQGQDPFIGEQYSDIDVTGSDDIAKKMEDDSYKRRFQRVAMVAFLLHMWREAKYLDCLPPEDRSRARSRVLKYTYLLEEILWAAGDGNVLGQGHLPTYHLIAFLRGVMLANIIEHSFWNIHRRLSPGFRDLNAEAFEREAREQQGGGCTEWLLIIVLVDGLREKTGPCLGFKPYENNQSRRVLLRFPTEEERREFVAEHMNGILEADERGFWKALETRGPEPVARIEWLTKARDPALTEWLRLSFDGKSPQWVSVDRVVISFAGYRELCPGKTDGTCGCSSETDGGCPRSDRCPYYAQRRHPDISRLVELQSQVRKLDEYLRDLIHVRLHERAQLARMNDMGMRVIGDLLERYRRNPRTMHDRVWARLRVYNEMNNVAPVIAAFAKKPIVEREMTGLPDDVFRVICDWERGGDCAEASRYSLVRRIIEHVSGMTDRFIANEYNRAHQCGREIEPQDETYFFS